ncbi:MAG: hypothetical protein GY749_41445 [Desulfobacteraceae bacterium]|nr:hypothetical protein [Desulfobacteraceae bacterium]
MFSTVQYENWLWGLSLIVYTPIFLLTTGLLINASNISIRLKLIISAILSTIATFSFANGISLWLLLLPFNTLFDSDENMEKKTVPYFSVVVYFLFFFLIIGLYFKGYRRPSHHPSLMAVFSNPTDAVCYFFIWAGASFTPLDLSAGNPSYYIGYIAAFTGGFIFILFISVAVYNLLKANSRQLTCFYPWFVIGIFSVTSGFALTVGRSGFGIAQALSSRYVASSIFLSISALVSVYLTYVFHFRNKGDVAGRIFKIVQATVLFLMLILHIYTYILYIPAMEKLQWFAKNGKLGLQFSELVYDETRLKTLWHDPKDLLSKFSDLVQYGLLDFKPVSPGLLTWVKKNREGNMSHGFFGECSLVSENELYVSGWAYQPKKTIPADNVIITYTKEGCEPRPVGITMPWKKRPGVEQLFKSRSMLNCGFSEIIDISGLPAGKLTISAWTVDVTANTVYKLRNNFQLTIAEEQK